MSVLAIVGIVVTVLVLLVVAYFIYSGIAISRQYEELMSAKHISEISLALAELKEKALGQEGIVEQAVLLEQNCFISSLGMAIIYSIDKREDGAAYHHLSISQEGKVLAHSFQLTMAAWLANILGIETSLVSAPPIGSEGPQIRHVFFDLEPEKQAHFEKAAVNSYTESEVSELYKAVITSRDQIAENSKNVMSASNSSKFQP